MIDNLINQLKTINNVTVVQASNHRINIIDQEADITVSVTVDQNIIYSVTITNNLKDFDAPMIDIDINQQLQKLTDILTIIRNYNQES